MGRRHYLNKFFIYHPYLLSMSHFAFYLKLLPLGCHLSPTSSTSADSYSFRLFRDKEMDGHDLIYYIHRSSLVLIFPMSKPCHGITQLATSRNSEQHDWVKQFPSTLYKREMYSYSWSKVLPGKTFIFSRLKMLESPLPSKYHILTWSSEKPLISSCQFHGSCWFTLLTFLWAQSYLIQWA